MAVTDHPAVRDRLVRLLTAELQSAWDKAISAGACPDDLAAAVDRRRERLREALRDPPSPVPLDDPPPIPVGD